MNARVSVVMPSYNHAAFVGEGIQSVLDQSFRDFEIVVTDDASRDGTPDVIGRFSDARIKLQVSPENRGGVVTGNSAIRRSSGEYIARLNSDDYFLPGKLEKQVEFLDAHPQIAAVFAMPRLIDERGKALAGGYREFAFPFSHAQPSRLEWLRRFFFHGNSLCFPSVLIRRAVLDEVGLLDVRMANLPDLDMWVRLCMTHEIHVMQEELVAFRKLDNERNMSGRSRATKLRVAFENFQILKHYRQLDPGLARKIFADDVVRWAVDVTKPYEVWLSELALRVPWRSHSLFALDTMFGALGEGGDPRPLIKLTGTVDPFGIDMVDEMRRMLIAAKPARP